MKTKQKARFHYTFVHVCTVAQLVTAVYLGSSAGKGGRRQTPTKVFGSRCLQGVSFFAKNISRWVFPEKKGCELGIVWRLFLTPLHPRHPPLALHCLLHLSSFVCLPMSVRILLFLVSIAVSGSPCLSVSSTENLELSKALSSRLE